MHGWRPSMGLPIWSRANRWVQPAAELAGGVARRPASAVEAPNTARMTAVRSIVRTLTLSASWVNCVYAENVSREPRRPCNDVDRRPRAWQHPYWCSGTWRAGPFTLIAEKLRLADNTIKEGSSAVRRGVGAEIAASFRAERDNGTHDGGQERAP
jgi:hypothetical protein